jgi:hypothetical protein
MFRFVSARWVSDELTARPPEGSVQIRPQRPETDQPAPSARTANGGQRRGPVVSEEEMRDQGRDTATWPRELMEGSRNSLKRSRPCKIRPGRPKILLLRM